MSKAKQSKETGFGSKKNAPLRVTSFRALPINDLVIARFQVRKQNVHEELDELAASIEKYGLLQPIVVCKSDVQFDKWEIICGQRRFLAHKQILHWPTIMAGIIDHEITYEEGLAISANENVFQLEMTRKDLVDLCADLFRKYGTVKDVASETKLPYHVVRKYIRFEALPPDLKKRVDAKEFNTDFAMKVQDAASGTGIYDKTKADKLIKILKTVDNPIQKKIIELTKKNPTVVLEKIVKTAEKPEQTLKLTLTLGARLARPLIKYAEDSEMDTKAAAEGLIEEGLKEGGYISEKG